MRANIVVLFFFVVATATPKVNAVENTRQQDHLEELRQIVRQKDDLEQLRQKERQTRHQEHLEELGQIVRQNDDDLEQLRQKVRQNDDDLEELRQMSQRLSQLVPAATRQLKEEQEEEEEEVKEAIELRQMRLVPKPRQLGLELRLSLVPRQQEEEVTMKLRQLRQQMRQLVLRRRQMVDISRYSLSRYSLSRYSQEREKYYETYWSEHVLDVLHGRCVVGSTELRYAQEVEKHFLEQNLEILEIAVARDKKTYLEKIEKTDPVARDKKILELLAKLPDPTKLPDPEALPEELPEALPEELPELQPAAGENASAKQLSQPQRRQTGNLWIAAGLSAAILFPMILTVLVFRNLEKQKKSGRKTHAFPIDDLVGDTN